MLPFFAVIGAVPQALIGTEEEQTWRCGVLHHRKAKAVHIFGRGQARPFFAVIGGVVEVSVPVIEAVIIHHDEGFTRVFSGYFNLRNPGTFGAIRQAVAYIFPVFAAIAGDLDVAVIGAYPDHILVGRAGSNGKNGAIILRIGGIVSEAPGDILVHFGGIVGGEVWRDNLPGFT